MESHHHDGTQQQQQLQQLHSQHQYHVLPNNTAAPAAPSSSSSSLQQLPLRSTPTTITTEPKVKSGVLGSTSNLLNSIVGAGIVAIPFALKESGLFVGILLLLLVAYLTDKSLRLLIHLAWYHPKFVMTVVTPQQSSQQPSQSQVRVVWNVRTYEDLLSLPYGHYGSAFISASMLTFSYGAMVAYMLVIKDTVPTILGIGAAAAAAAGSEDDDINNNNNNNNPNNNHALMSNFIKRDIILVITTFIIVFPLAVQRDMAHLAFTSFWSVMADVVLVIFIACFSPIQRSLQESGGFLHVLFHDNTNLFHSHVFIGLGIFSSAMACQHCAFLVKSSLDHPTPHRWARVTFQSVFLGTALTAILGVFGYLGFLSNTQGDILNNFQPDTVVANGARVLLAVTMFFTYPMEAFVARHVLVQYLYNGDLDHETIDEQTGQIQPERKYCYCFGRRETITLCIYLATLLPALVVDNLGPVLSITGAIGGSCISYMGPGLAYLGVNSDFFLAWVEELIQAHPTTTTTSQSPTNHQRPQQQQQQQSSSTMTSEPSTTELELPVLIEGDYSPITTTTNTTMASRQHPWENSSSVVRGGFLHFGTRPWWWYMAGFPIWCAIAQWADGNMKAKLGCLSSSSSSSSPSPWSSHPLIYTTNGGATDRPVMMDGPLSAESICFLSPQDGGVEGDYHHTTTTTNNNNIHDSHPVIGPNKHDCIISIFLILFGFVAAVVGVASNVYVEVKKHFSSQHQ